MTECGSCRFWTETIKEVLGECEIDMECKTKHTPSCGNYEKGCE